MIVETVSFAFLTGGALGPGELVLVFVVVLLLFGPRRLPEIARMIGKIASEMRRASREFQDQVMKIEDQLPSREDVSSMFVEPEKPDALPPPVLPDGGEKRVLLKWRWPDSEDRWGGSPGHQSTPPVFRPGSENPQTRYDPGHTRPPPQV